MVYHSKKDGDDGNLLSEPYYNYKAMPSMQL